MSNRECAVALGGIGAGFLLAYLWNRRCEFQAAEPLRVVKAFFKAQDARDLSGMCSLVDNNILYINEPHPSSRHICGRHAFQAAFANSPCIWAEDARLEILNIAYNPMTRVVFVERLDQYLIQGKWLKIPISGFLEITKQGKIAKWKDYFCYKKYKEQTIKLFGKGFSLFKQKKSSN